jgi:hypothetical protein
MPKGWRWFLVALWAFFPILFRPWWLLLISVAGIFFIGMAAASAEGFKVVPLRAMRYLTYAVPASGAHRGYRPQVG